MSWVMGLHKVVVRCLCRPCLCITAQGLLMLKPLLVVVASERTSEL
jgi:hypothetical protein